MTNAITLPATRAQPAPWVLSPDEVATVLAMNRGAVYEALARKEIPGFKIGGVWKIPAADLARMCGIHDAQRVLDLRDELRRSQHDIRGVVAMADLDTVLAGQLLDAIQRVGGVIAALTAQGDGEFAAQLPMAPKPADVRRAKADRRAA